MIFDNKGILEVNINPLLISLWIQTNNPSRAQRLWYPDMRIGAPAGGTDDLHTQDPVYMELSINTVYSVTKMWLWIHPMLLSSAP